MSGSPHTHLTPSESIGSLHSGEQDRTLTSRVSTSAQVSTISSSSDFSVHTAVLSTLQRHTGIEPNTQASLRQGHFASQTRVTNRMVVSAASSFEERFSKLVTTSALALQSFSLGRLNQGNDDHQLCFDEELVVNRRSNRRKKTFGNHRNRKLFSRLDKNINELNALNLRKEKSEKNLVGLLKKYKKAKKLIRKNPSKNLTGKKKLINLVAQLKKEKSGVQKSISQLRKKHDSANKLLNKISLSDSRKNKIKKFIKTIGLFQKISKKKPFKIKNIKTIKTLLRKRAKQQALAEKNVRKIFFCAPPSAELSPSSNLCSVPREPLPLLRGGFSPKQLGEALTSALAIQSTLPTVGAPFVGRNSRRATVTEASTVPRPSSMVHVEQTILGTNTTGRGVVNPKLDVDAHDLAFSAQKPVLGDTKSHVSGILTTRPIDFPKEEFIRKSLERDKIIGKQNNSIEKLLKKKSFIFHTTNCESHPEIIITAAIHFIKDCKNRPHAAKIIAKRLLKASGHPLKKGEDIPENVINSIINDWISRTVFGKSVEEFILQTAANYGDGCFLHTIKDNITDIINKKLSSEITNEPRGYLVLDRENYIINNIIKSAMPIINKEEFHNIVIGTPEFGYIHAGSLLAVSQGIDINSFTKEDALELGKMLYIQLTEGAADIELIKFFMLPIMLSYALKNPSDIQSFLKFNIEKNTKNSIIGKAIETYFSEVEKYEKENNHVLKFFNLLNSYESRTQLAENELKKCKSIYGEDAQTLTPYLNNNNNCLYRPLGSSYGPMPYSNHAIEPINDIYERQNSKIADGFLIFNKLLISASLNSLNDDEKIFIHASKIKSLTDQFRNIENTNKPSCGLNDCSEEYVAMVDKYNLQLLPGVELIIANNDTEERIYAIHIFNNRAMAIRVDRNAENYINLIKPKKVIFKKLPEDTNKNDYILQLLTSKLKSFFIPKKTIKNPKQSIHTLVDNLAQKGRVKFLKDLHDHGYNPTFSEKAENFILRLVPFYNFITEARNGEIEAALNSFTFDVLSLIPILGEATALLNRFTQLAGEGGIIAMREAISTIGSMGARMTVKEILKQGGESFMRHGILPASQVINKKAFVSLSMTLIRTIDPGLELVGSVSKLAVKKAINLGRSMESGIPNLKNALDKIINKNLPNKVIHDPLTTYKNLGVENKHVIIKDIESAPKNYATREFSKISNINQIEKLSIPNIDFYTYPGKNILENKDGIISLYNKNGQLVNAIKIKNKYYQISKIRKPGYYIINGKEDTFITIDKNKEVELADPIEYVKFHCITKRSPVLPEQLPSAKPTCIYYSRGLADELEANKQHIIKSDDIINTLVPRDGYVGMFNGPENKLYLQYNDVFFLVKESDNNVLVMKQYTKNPMKKFFNVLMGSDNNPIIYGYYPYGRKNRIISLKEWNELGDIPKDIIPFDKDYKFTDLTREEVSAIKDYARVDNEAINAYMRLSVTPSMDDVKTTWTTEAIVDKINMLRSALKKIPHYKGVVYRGQAIDRKIFNEIEVGSIINNKYFLSTSLNERVVVRFMPRDDQNIKSLKLIIDTEESAYPIYDWTHKKDEQEMLISDNTFFIVTSKDDHSGVIRMKELGREEAASYSSTTVISI